VAQATFESLLQELSDPSKRVSSAGLTRLSNLTTAQLSSFVSVWRSLDRAARTQRLRELIELTEDSAELNFDGIFLEALVDPDAGVRSEAIQGLWEYESRDLIEPLLTLLEEDPDAAVRMHAALALGRFVLQAEFEAIPDRDAQRVADALRRAFDDPVEAVEVRGRALESLGPRSEEWVRDLIDDAFASGDRRLELSAVHAMGRSADVDWLPSVLGQLESDDEEMRYEAVVAAGSIADAEAVSHLQTVLHDEDMEVQMAAIGALGEIGGEEARDALRELLGEGDERFAEAIAAALAEIDFEEDPLALQLPE